MTRIYLRHENHGEKIAYLEAEAEMDEQNGWERFDPTKPVPLPADPEIEPKRRGRPRKEQ